MNRIEVKTGFGKLAIDICTPSQTTLAQSSPINMALRNTTRKATALVPVAAPVIVEALRAGPLTTQELWAKCISDSVQNAGDSAGSGLGERLGLHQVFKAKS